MGYKTMIAFGNFTDSPESSNPALSAFVDWRRRVSVGHIKALRRLAAKQHLGSRVRVPSSAIVADGSAPRRTGVPPVDLFPVETDRTLRQDKRGKGASC